MENRAISVAASSAELNWFCFPWPQQVTDDIIARTICRADKLSGWVLSVEFYWKITALDNDTPIEADVAQFIIQLMLNSNEFRAVFIEFHSLNFLKAIHGAAESAS